MKMNTKNCPFSYNILVIPAASASTDGDSNSKKMYLQTSGRKHLMSETCQHNENEFNIMDIRQSREWESLCLLYECVCL